MWVTPATDVSCFSDLGCIFVGSAVIWGAGWRRWAWSGEDHIWDGLVEPVGWGEGLVETMFLNVFRHKVFLCFFPPLLSLPFRGLLFFELRKAKGFSSIPFNFFSYFRRVMSFTSISELFQWK